MNAQVQGDESAVYPQSYTRVRRCGDCVFQPPNLRQWFGSLLYSIDIEPQNSPAEKAGLRFGFILLW